MKAGACLLAVASIAAAGCGGATARESDTERLPGRVRPLYEHTWTHPRDLKFPENRFTPPDAKAALVTTAAGLRAYAIGDPSEHVVQIAAAIPLGRSLEQANEIGAAELLSRLLSQQIDERLGASFMGRVQVDQDVDLTRLTLRVLDEDWKPALAALVGTLRQPRIDPAAIEAYRTGPGFSRQTRGLGGPAFRPAVELSRLLASYPLAPPDPGVMLRREAVSAIAARSLRPNAVVLAIGGGITGDAVQRELESLTAGWQAPAAAGAAAIGAGTVTANPTRSRTIDEPGYTTWIAVGHPMPAVAAADEAAVAVMTDILNIRLNITIREIRGLANSTQLLVPATTRHDGLLQVRSGARPESVAPIISYSVQELTRIREAGGAPTADELAQVKGGQVLGKWQGSLDGARDASLTYATETARFGSLDHLMKWPESVGAVTAQDVTAAAQKYVHPEMIGVVVIGQIEEARKARHPRWPAALDEVMAGSSR